MNSSEFKIDYILSLAKDNCLLLINNSINLQNSTTKLCEQTFDGFYCWPKTEAGTVAKQSCSNHFIKSTNQNGSATKFCTENGTWFINKTTNKPWSNLTQCTNMYISIIDEDKVNNIYKKWLPIIKEISFAGNILSIFFLIIALILFLTFRRLKCERNRLHTHLFFSYLFRAITFILKYILFVNGTALFNDTIFIDGQPKFTYTWTCKFLVSIRYYFILSNFIFMLMEGVYLHNLIFLNIFSEYHGTGIYCVLGWVTPFIFMIPWILLRIVFEDNLCWTQKDVKYIGLLLDIPICVTVVINFVLFILIVRVLILKIYFTSLCIQQRKTKYSKLLKSTLILIPLYGIPYTISLVLSFFNYEIKLEIIWLFFDQTFSSFQGFFASLVYCLLNSEVQIEIKRKWNTINSLPEQQIATKKCHSRNRTISNNTQQFSLQTDDTLENLNLFGIVGDDILKKDTKLINSEDIV